MNNCKICNRPTEQNICEGCTGNWLVIRKAISERMQLKHPNPTAETQPMIDSEVRRLEDSWRNNRPAFVREINNWYDPFQLPE
jgi:hypothetical protein